MPTCYDTWTVLPHDPIERLTDHAWRVGGRMSNGTPRFMSPVRLADGRVLIHNAIAREDPLMAEIDAWGEVAAILVPNAFHRMDCRIMPARYPKAKVYAPAGAAKAVAKAPTERFRADVQRLGDAGPRRLIPSHGRDIHEDAGERLREALRLL